MDCPNSDGRVKSSVVLHIPFCGACARQVTFDIIQPSLGWGKHLLKSSGPSALFQEDRCSQDGPNMLPFCCTENRGAIGIKTRSLHKPTFIGKFMAPGDLIWRNYQVAANAVICLNSHHHCNKKYCSVHLQLLPHCQF